MKKLILMFIVLSLTLSLLLTGCGKDKKTTTAPDPFNMTGIGYSLIIISTDLGRSEYSIIISSFAGEAQISTVSLEINNEPVVLESESYEGWIAWFGGANLEQGQNINCDLTINESSYDFDLKTPYHPVVNWPDEYDPASATQISWSLTGNSEYQYFEGSAFTDYENNDDKYVKLSPADRSYTIPANWLNPDLESYTFALSEYSFDVKGKVAGIIIDGDYGCYGYEKKTGREITPEKIKKLIEIAIN